MPTDGSALTTIATTPCVQSLPAFLYSAFALIASLYAATHSCEGNSNAMKATVLACFARMAGAQKQKVHGRGNKRLDAVLDFVAFAARPMPLVTLLDEAPRRIAAILSAPICSLY